MLNNLLKRFGYVHEEHTESLKNDILALFQDNFNNEISAQDMRTYIEAIFDEKEEPVIKIPTLAVLASNNTKIYEGSLVVVYNDLTNTGIYLSKINQPAAVTDLWKL